jgi:hypothetical protein
MAKAERTVAQLVDMIANKSLELPEMQREYVWRSTRVRDLLDSLYRGYPSGVILTWQTSQNVARNEFAVSSAAQASGPSMLLLDGQQRLTSLSAVLRGELISVRGRKRPIDILFNLDHPEGVSLITEVYENDDTDIDDDDDLPTLDDETSEENDLQRRMRLRTFVVASKALAALPNWVSVTEVMKTPSDAPFLRKAGVTDFNDPNYDKYTQRLGKLRGIRDYVYRMDVLEDTMSYEEVTEIFVRVNSLGAKLRSSDLALAQITARWPGSLAQFRDFQDECTSNGFELDLGTHLRMMVSLLTSQCRFATVASIPREDLESGWLRARTAMEYSLNFARANLGIESVELLASPLALIALGYWADLRQFRMSQDESKLLRRWLLTANAKGRWSRGSSETILNEDLATLRDGGGLTQLLDRLHTQVGRLDVQPEDLEGRTARASLFKTMYLAFRQDDAHDWFSSIRISTKSSGARDKLHFHHIFPQAYLKKHLPDLRQGQVDDIANLTFIGGGTNRHISATAPEEYLVDLASTNPEGLTRQQVPLDTELYTYERYFDFLAARRKLIAERLNRFLS